MVYPNPLFGFSEGEMKESKMKNEYKEFCQRSLKGSNEWSSRSRSKLLKLREAEKEKNQDESFAYLIQKHK